MCCTSLRSCGLTIGVVCVILSFWGMVSAFISLEQKRRSNSTDNTFELICLTIVASVIPFVASFLVVLGILKKRHGLLLPWLITYAVGLGFYMILFLNKLLRVITKGTVTREMLIIAVAIVLFSCLYYVIYLVYKEIKASKDVQPREIFLESSNIY